VLRVLVVPRDRTAARQPFAVRGERPEAAVLRQAPQLLAGGRVIYPGRGDRRARHDQEETLRGDDQQSPAEREGGGNTGMIDRRAEDFLAGRHVPPPEFARSREEAGQTRERGDGQAVGAEREIGIGSAGRGPLEQLLAGRDAPETDLLFLLPPGPGVGGRQDR